MISRFRLPITLLMITVLAALSSCKHDGPSNPDASAAPALVNIWPHKDGNAWTYDATFSLRPTPAAGKALPETPVPSMKVLHAMMQEPLTGQPDISAEGTYEIMFDGMTVTQSGATGQRLRSEMLLESILPGGQKSLSMSASPDDFLRLVASSRPDLRAAIMDAKNWSEKDHAEFGAPFFLRSLAFAYEDSGYYSYGDLDLKHSWIYLGNSLKVGHKFTVQLVPSLTDDIWLKGEIWSRSVMRIGNKIYRNVIECLYLIDLGDSIVRDENGDNVGVANNYIYAITHFAPSVGPIRGIERHISNRNDAIQGPTEGQIVEYQMNLISKLGGQ